MTWTKGGQPLDPKRVNVRNSEKDSVFFIRQAQRDDSGKYEITVKILDELEDKATIDLLVIGKDFSNGILFFKKINVLEFKTEV